MDEEGKEVEVLRCGGSGGRVEGVVMIVYGGGSSRGKQTPQSVGRSLQSTLEIYIY